MSNANAGIYKVVTCLKQSFKMCFAEGHHHTTRHFMQHGDPFLLAASLFLGVLKYVFYSHAWILQRC
jgi:hypothetical protein